MLYIQNNLFFIQGKLRMANLVLINLCFSSPVDFNPLDTELFVNISREEKSMLRF